MHKRVDRVSTAAGEGLAQDGQKRRGLSEASTSGCASTAASGRRGWECLPMHALLLSLRPWRGRERGEGSSTDLTDA